MMNIFLVYGLCGVRLVADFMPDLGGMMIQWIQMEKHGE